MFNIIYCENSKSLYYQQIEMAFNKSKNFKLQKKIESNTNFVIFGPGFFCDESLERNKNLDFSFFKKPKVMFLNKEYKNLDKKFQIINEKNIEIVLTVHHDYEVWNKECKRSKFYKIPFGFNPEIFKEYDKNKTFDIGFTGNLFNKGVYKETNIMGRNFNNVRERIFDILKNDKRLSKYKMFLGENIYLTGENYGKAINSSKIWISTPSAIDIIGPRYYEVLGSNTLLFAKNLEKVYDGLFDPDLHFVSFKDDLTNFTEKLIYYIENEEDRKKISQNGFEHALKNHTWENRIDKIFEILKECRE